MSAVMSLFVFRVTFWLFWELLMHSTGFFVISLSRNCFLAVREFEVRFFIGDVSDSTPFFSNFLGIFVFSLVSAVKSVWIIANLKFPHMSPGVAVRQLLGMLEVFFFWSLVCHLQLRSEDRAFLFRCWPSVRTQPVILFCASCFWGPLCPSGLLFEASGLVAALAPT